MRIITNDAIDIKIHRKIFRRYLLEIAPRVYVSPSIAIIRRLEEEILETKGSWTIIKISKKYPGGVKVEKRGGVRKGAKTPLIGVEIRQNKGVFEKWV